MASALGNRLSSNLVAVWLEKKFNAVCMLAILCLLTSWVWHTMHTSPLLHLDEKVLMSTADIVIQQLTLQQFDKDGHVSHSLQTPYLRHVPLNNIHHIKTPHVVVVQQNQPSWEINAQEAIVFHGGKEITFHNHVTIHQKQDEHSLEKILNTEEITYFPEKKLAETMKAITFKQAENSVEAIGMQADLNQNRVKLLSHTRGIYEPHQG